MALRCFSLISLLAGASLAAGVAIAAESAAPAKAPDQAAAQDSQKAATGDAKAAAAPAGQAAEGKDAAAGGAAPQGDQKAAAGGGGTPQATAESAEKGSLKSPISDPKQAAPEGQKVFMAAGCNGCHGGSGGGGMGPPLTNQVWIYGSDDDTLFRLVALGSDGLQKQGYKRKGSESVVGPMPPHGTIVKSDEDLWKIIAWIRSINPSSAQAPSTAATGGGSTPPPQ